MRETNTTRHVSAESSRGLGNRGEYKITLTKAVTVGMAKIKHQSECG